MARERKKVNSFIQAIQARDIKPLRIIPTPSPEDCQPTVREDPRERRRRERENKQNEILKKRRDLRRHVTMSKEVAHDLLRAYKAWQEGEEEYPAVFLVGENGKQVIKDIERLGNLNNGCGEMPSITSSEMSNAYVRLARRGLTGCGIARVGESFDNDNIWGSDSGSAIFTKNMKYIISYDGRSFVGATVIDKDEEIFGDDDYEEDDYGFNKNLLKLEIRMGK